jgi:hypothetical protein
LNPASTTFVLGYHGCDAAVAERIFVGKTSLSASENDYDWLGHGVYFWEHSARRAYDFACEVRDRSVGRKRRLKRPAVVGAIIDLGNCLNLLDSESIEMVSDAYLDLVRLHREAEEPLPQNSGGQDRLLRRLDCAVLEMLHATRQERAEPAFDSVRAAFIEGTPIYEDAGFHAKNHIQLCVRNVACIKGYFRPLTDEGKPLEFT